jgi:hypothetical protein
VQSVYEHTQMGSSALQLLTLVSTPRAAMQQLQAALAT